MDVTARLRSLEKSLKPEKLEMFLEDCRYQQVDLRPWTKRLKSLFAKMGISFEPNHERYRKCDNGSEYGLTAPREGAVWSGEGHFRNIPMRGDTVYANMNGFGFGKVRGYFVEFGGNDEKGNPVLYLGVYVEPNDPPAWWLAQNWGNLQLCGMFFGRELKRYP